MTTELVTIAEVADALGIPGQVDAVHEGLISDGLKILEDWAGRPAISFTDAKRTLDRHRKQQAEWAERRAKENRELGESRAAQREFDDFAGRRLPELRKAEPFKTGAANDQARMIRARQEAFDAIKDRYSSETLAKITVGPIMTIEPGNGQAFRLMPILTQDM